MVRRSPPDADLAAAEERREQAIRSLLERIRAITYLAAADDQASTLWISPQIEALTGFSQAEWIADPGLWLRQLHPEDRERVHADYLRSRTTGEPCRSEHRLLTKDGRSVWFLDEGTIFPETPGQPRLMGGVKLDITAQREMAEALAASEARARALFKGSPLPTYAWRQQGDDFVLVDYSTAAAAATRGRIHEVLGKSARAMYPDMPEVLEDLTRCAAEGKTIKRDMLYRYRTTGDVRHTSVTYGFVAPDTVLVHADDIDERVQAEEELHCRTRQQATVAELGQHALAGLEPQKLMDRTVRAVVETLGVEYAKVLELVPGRDALLLRAGVGWREGSVGAVVPKLLTENAVVSGMSVVIGPPDRPFGELGAHSKRKRTFNADDVHFLESLANILADAILRKRQEGLRLQLLERVMIAQDEERRRIARELHDESGQSLTSLIIGLATIEHARSLKTARASAHRLGEIASQALEELRRLSRGLHPRVLDDHGLVPAVERHAEDHARLHGVVVQVDTSRLGSERLPPAVETALYRMTQEALTNVAKHAGAKGVEIRLSRDAKAVELIVHDDGIGFDTAAATAPGAQGERLGLAGIRERAALLGGSVTIASVPAGGTTLSVRVPAEASG